MNHLDIKKPILIHRWILTNCYQAEITQKFNKDKNAYFSIFVNGTTIIHVFYFVISQQKNTSELMSLFF